MITNKLLGFLRRATYSVRSDPNSQGAFSFALLGHFSIEGVLDP